jgi:glucose/arabinose dehydrogenase
MGELEEIILSVASHDSKSRRGARASHPKMNMRKKLTICACALSIFPIAATAQTLTGQSAFTDFSKESPGVRRKLTVADLPQPFATTSSDNGPRLVARPKDAWPKAPNGFKVEMYADKLDNPRELRTAPNGDLFLAESETGKIRVFRGVTADGHPRQQQVFATGLHEPFGIAFYPLGNSPRWVYVGNTDSVVRFAYQNGDMQARGKPETIVAELPGGGRVRGGGHWTRDLAFSLDGKTMFVSVGSRSNVDDTDNNPAEKNRADVLAFTPEGKDQRVYVSGVRNAVGITVNPQTGELWGSVNERDGLGDNLVPDYITHFTPGGFYGWPWFYMGGHWDPRLQGKHPEMRDKVITPDVLLQPHFASLEMVFYEGAQFPAEFRGDAFAAEHGSWNRHQRTGYEVIRVPMRDGKATGEYEDFLTGFVTSQGDVWGRPVGVTVGADGSLFVSDDGSRTIWRVSYGGK